jgi:surface polysaccharide O-acyltransferase-like enzyme
MGFLWFIASIIICVLFYALMKKIIFDISVSMIILTLLIVCMTIRSLLDKSINISYPLLDNGGVSFSHLIPL